MTERKIHMTGVCGIAMGTLAQMLRRRGFTVTGSDSGIYPPMSDILAGSDIRLYEGYSEENLSAPDLAIIGNAVSRGNPEVEAVLNRGIPCLSMARALHDFFLAGKDVIAVSGTHGKSTTAALLAHILHEAGSDPSFFIGGVVKNFSSNFRLGAGKHFVVEGDEYDSAFFEKVPKFIFYRPRHLVITSLEFDHADIYRDLDEIELWFRRLVNLVPSEGTVVFNRDYGNLREVTAGSLSRILSYGSGGDVTYRFTGYQNNHGVLAIRAPEGRFDVETSLAGKFNFDNIAAASAMALSLGASPAVIQDAVKSFAGVKRRQDVIFERDGITVMEDFAHHPTSIKSVVCAMREKYPAARIWTLYEPRSATSRRKVFQDELPQSFFPADTVILKKPYRGSFIDENDRLDPDMVVARINREFRGSIRASGGYRSAHLLESSDLIVDFVVDSIDRDEENLIIIMSNGDFDGIYDKLCRRLEEIYDESGISS